jgi:hypothetical protein
MVVTVVDGFTIGDGRGPEVTDRAMLMCSTSARRRHAGNPERTYYW